MIHLPLHVSFVMSANKAADINIVFISYNQCTTTGAFSSSSSSAKDRVEQTFSLTTEEQVYSF